MSIPQKLIKAEDGSLVNMAQVTKISKSPADSNTIGSPTLWRVIAEFSGIAILQAEWQSVTPYATLAIGLSGEEADLLLEKIEDWNGGLTFPVAKLLERSRLQYQQKQVDTYA